MLLERAYAKINLTLNVLGKRPDGYHEVDMVMQSIDLSDEVALEWLPESMEIVMESQATSIPLDGRNLAVIAAEKFLSAANLTRGVRIYLTKNIPVAAGLAGGSADAAAVLRGLNRLAGHPFSLDELAELGAQIGSDVPFCIYNGCAIASGRGEKITHVQPALRSWVVLLKPPLYVSTTEVYQSIQADDFSNKRVSSAMTERFAKGCTLAEIESLICNDLQPVTFRLYPEVAQLHRKMQSVSGLPCHMSGSGPTLFTLVPTQSAGQRVYNALRGFAKDVYLARLFQPNSGGRQDETVFTFAGYGQASL
nr:4-(cytidine 5'-diphospho)-2-C-methyl-D-erythritol kinase [Alicyclobacillus sp. TC]